MRYPTGKSGLAASTFPRVPKVLDASAIAMEHKLAFWVVGEVLLPLSG